MKKHYFFILVFFKNFLIVSTHFSVMPNFSYAKLEHSFKFGYSFCSFCFSYLYFYDVQFKKNAENE